MVQGRNREGQGRAPGGAPGEIVLPRTGTIPPPMDRGNDVIGVHGRFLAAVGDGLLNHFHRVFGQQLQNPHVLSRAGGWPLPLLEGRPQLVKAGRQFPLGKYEGMIQSRRPATEKRQIVLRLHDPFPAGVTAGVAGDDARATHHLDPIHICFDRHRLEGPASRNTVTVRVEPHRLVFVPCEGRRENAAGGGPKPRRPGPMYPA
jgi:hypothetical protein